jgi:AraC-like DNA-binding protein
MPLNAAATVVSLSPVSADLLVRGVLLGVLGLLAAVLWRDHRHAPTGRTGRWLALGLCGQVIGAIPSFEAAVPARWQAPLVGVSVANAMLFWLLLRTLFDDGFVLRRRHAGLWAVVAALGSLPCLHLLPEASPGAALLALVPRGMPVLWAVLSAGVVALSWSGDLVEGRRHLRGLVAGWGIAYTLGMAAVRWQSPGGRLSAPAALVDVLLLLAVVVVLAWHLLRIDLGALGQPARTVRPATAAPVLPTGPVPTDDPPPGPATSTARPTTPAPSIDPIDERLATALARLMTHERAFCLEDLSLGELARRLTVPEYRLRRHINQRLGHRNFNAFINQYRLQEARAALQDPARREESILGIALACGFQSIGPFNRAFKADAGCTPTEFRRQNLVDS